MQDKKQLRSFYKKQRSNIQDKDNKAEAAARILINDPRISRADTVLIYSSFGSELGTEPLFRILLSMGKNTAFPKCRENGIMTFHTVTASDELFSGAYGIHEPPDDLPEAVPTDVSVCIVPGLAFTLDGGRLGYGGGFYDRFTAANPWLYTIGYSFEELVVPELPIMPHDLKVNALATEERMVYCSG